MRLTQLYIIILVIVVAPFAASAQVDGDRASQQIDSILARISSGSPDSIKAAAYYQAAKVAAYSGTPDTTIKYANLSLEYCRPADWELTARNHNSIGYAYYFKGDVRESINHYLQSADIYLRKGDTTKAVVLYCNVSSFYGNLSMMDSCFYHLNRCLDISVRRCDTALMVSCYGQFALISLNRELFDDAGRYSLQALRLDSLAGIRDENTAQHQMVYGLSQISKYASRRDTSCLYTGHAYLKKSVLLYDSIQTDLNRYMAYSHIASSYIELAKLTRNKAYADSCLHYYKLAEAFYLNEGYNIGSYLDASGTYISYLLFLKKYAEAKNFAISLRKHITDDTPKLWITRYNRHLISIYESLGEWENAYRQMCLMDQYNRELVSDSVLDVIAGAKAEQAVLREKISREKDEQVHAAETSRMRTLIFSLTGGLVLVLLFVFYINSQNRKIKAQRDEIATQKDIITEQWREVDYVNGQLVSSINYARRIQCAAVSSENDVHSVFPDSFVFYRPRDIVSGDFYRCGRCGRYSVMVTADCTGHGIPGAFLSMLGLSALKEYMATESDAENPGSVLDRIRDFIKTTLVSAEDGSDVNDGMDMTVCCYDYDNMRLNYAIACQTAVIIRNGEAIRLKGDNMPVGRFLAEREHFKSFSVSIQKGDMVYTFSDGIQDQFGGGSDRKFTIKRLLALLVSIADKPAAEQCESLERAILDWRGDTPQVDDMTLVGVRV